MSQTIKMFAEPQSSSDIVHKGKIYRPYRKGMKEGWDRVKSRERRPCGWGRYLFVGGYIVFYFRTGRFITTVRKLPPAVKRQREGRA